MDDLYAKLVTIGLSIGAGWFISEYRLRTKEDAALINDHINDLNTYSAALQEYWLHTPENREAEKVAAAKVRACFCPMGSFYGEAKAKLGQERFRDYQVSQLRLYSVGQGGAFDTAKRNFDAEKAIECYQIVSELRLNLRLARKEQLYSFGSFLRRCARLKPKWLSF